MWNYLATGGQRPVETKIQQNFVLKTKYIKKPTKNQFAAVEAISVLRKYNVKQ